VTAAGISNSLPLRYTTLLHVLVRLPGKAEEQKVAARAVGGAYFEAVGLAFIAGKAFDEMHKGEMYYNYTTTKFPVAEAPGISVFYQNEEGGIFHTYSFYARGLDMLNGAYHYLYLDLVPKGCDEDNLSYPTEWLRRHDKYEDFKR